MWLHVRAFDGQRNVIFESGRYLFATATLEGYRAEISDPDYDPNLHVWEAEQGIDAAVAAATGLPEGRTFHLSLNNVRLKDNRIPPRGFTNVAFEAIDAEPVGAVYADGQYWEDVAYPVGAQAVAAEVTLYYQTASREYVEFLRDENTTTAAGNILFGLWEDHNQSVPVEMAKLTVETDAKALARCAKKISRGQEKYLKRYQKEWEQCFARRTAGLSCDAASRDAAIAAEEASLRERIGGLKDRACAAQGLTPSSLGHGTSCPAPCAGIVLFDMNDVASCAVCLAQALSGEALDAAFGATPPALPSPLASDLRPCQSLLGKASGTLASKWVKSLARCEYGNALGNPPLDCSTDPKGTIGRAQDQSASKVGRCESFAGIPGCATAGNAAAVEACIETAIGGAVEPYTEVAFP
jgi:hypothetical protein